MDMTLYTTKHVAILELLTQISQCVEQNQPEKNNAEIVSLIAKLTAIIKMHLASEDNYLYPNLLKNPNAEIRNMAERYMAEMGNLSQVYNDFYVRFNTPSKISGNESEFKNLFTAVDKALRTRIQKEETELYKMVS